MDQFCSLYLIKIKIQNAECCSFVYHAEIPFLDSQYVIVVGNLYISTYRSQIFLFRGM